MHTPDKLKPEKTSESNIRNPEKMSESNHFDPPKMSESKFRAPSPT